MTKQEVRDENKESEGNPELKGRIRQVQHQLARRRMPGTLRGCSTSTRPVCLREG